MTRGKSILALIAALLITGEAAARERPAAPAGAMPEPPGSEICSVRASRNALLADASLRISGAFDRGLERTSYARDLAAWKLEQLTERAQLAASDASAVQERLRWEASVSEFTLAEEAANTEFIAATEAFDDARSRNRPRDACLALINVLGAINHVVRAAEERWSIVSAGYDAEAERRGVTLD